MTDVAAVGAFLDAAHSELAAAVRAFADQEIRPLPDPLSDDDARVQARELLAALGRSGWFGPIGERDLRALCLVRETLAAASPLADSVAALQALSITPILLTANEPMQQAWAEPALAGAAMGAFAMTEAEAGSDVGSIQTTAVREGDEYRLDGAKTLISNAGIADFYIVFASTDPEAGTRGISAFVVGAATAGLRFLRPQVMSAPHPLGDIELDGCRVPAVNRLGGEGEGFKLGMMTLDRVRASVGAAACGLGHRALEEALSHAKSRQQFGKSLGSFQLVQQKLARMATDLAAARLLVYRAAWETDRSKERVTLETAMAKAFATEAAQRIVDDAIQVLGGRGVLATHPVDRLYRSVRAMRIYEGTTEIQQLIIAGRLLADSEEGER